MPLKNRTLRRPARRMEEADTYDINDFMYDDDNRLNDMPEPSEEDDLFIDDPEEDMSEPVDENDLFEETNTAKPMADDKLKLECLKIAINVSKLANRKDVINVADELFKYVKGGSI